MMRFLDKHFDKLLLTFILLVFIGIGSISLRVGSERGVEWAKNSEILVTGAIIALVKGHRQEPEQPNQPKQ